jgi:predicted MFS family arabinose efflux permease
MAFLLAGVGSLSLILFRKANPVAALRLGLLVLLIGVALTLAAIATSSGALLIAGTAVAGVAYGPVFTGLFRSLSALARPDDRAATVAAIYTVSYLSFSVPALAAGVATTHWRLQDASLGYAAFVTALTAITAAASLAQSRSASA